MAMSHEINLSILIITLQILNSQLLSSTKDINCNFAQKSLCGWEQAANNDFNWSFYCHYTTDDCNVYIETSSRYKVDQISRLVSPIISPTKTQCFSFHYNMFGVRVNQLNIYIDYLNKSQPLLIWHRKHSQDNLWRRGYRTIQSETKYKIIIEATAARPENSTKSDGRISLRDTDLSDGVCPPFLQLADQACDFEQSFCMWKNNSDIHWKRGTSSEIKLNRKPPSDHTTRTDNGYFAYISTNQTTTSTSSKLLSTTLPATSQQRCLQFYYYIQRGSLARINVTVIYVDMEFQLLASQIGVDENAWSFAEVAIPGRLEHQILLHGMINDDANAVIAIDDINVVDDFCEGQGLCGFEYGFCDWRNLIRNQSRDISWLRSTGGEAVGYEPNMPALDKSNTDSGFFLFVDVSNTRQNMSATLSSTPIYICPSVCFTFWYYIKGENCGELQISFNNLYAERLLPFTSTITNKWTKQEMQINLDCSNKPYEIYVRAITGNGLGFIAIDDLSILAGACSQDETSTFTIPTAQTLPSTSPQDITTSSSTQQSRITSTTEKVATIPTPSTQSSASPPPSSSFSLSTVTEQVITDLTSSTHIANQTTPFVPPYTQILSRNNCEIGMVDCGDAKCILAIFVCDGAQDCDNNADEAACKLTCRDKEKNTFCEGFNNPQCIPKEQLCDRNADCINQADENTFLCGACHKTYCKTGRCFPSPGQGAPHCVCTDGEHTGRRCEIIKVAKPVTSPPAVSNDSIKWIAIPMMSMLVVIIAILLINIYCYRKYKWQFKAGLIPNEYTSLNQRNSMSGMTEMSPTQLITEEISDDVGEGEGPSRRTRDDPISMIHTPLSNYKLHRLYIGSIVLDSEGNIVAVSNA